MELMDEFLVLKPLVNVDQLGLGADFLKDVFGFIITISPGRAEDKDFRFAHADYFIVCLLKKLVKFLGEAFTSAQAQLKRFSLVS